MSAVLSEKTEANVNTSGNMATRAGLARVLTNGEMVYQDDFKPKNIMLTGGAGFIGSHVATLLAEKYPDYKVVVLDKLAARVCADYCATINNLNAVKDLPNFKFVKGCIQSFDLVAHILESENIDTIMHFAAQTHVDNSFGNSLEFTMNNTYGTHVLLEAARKWGGIKRFINVSTDEVYGESSLGKESGCDETSALEPTNPYSAAKAGAEMMVRSYMTSYKLPCIITRGNNVYGPHQFPEKLIPKMTLLASRGLELPVHGNGGAVRSYLHVRDVARAFDTVLHKGVIGEVYNIGTQKERSVLEVINAIAEHMKVDTTKIQHVEDRAFNDQRYYICDKKLLAMGWKEEETWESGLPETIDWYLKNGFAAYWENGNMDAALVAHPTLTASLAK